MPVISGTYAKAKLCLDTNTRTNRVIKIMSKRRMKKKFLGIDKSAFSLLQNEIAILKAVVFQLPATPQHSPPV
jgi:hypothetical protein